MTAFLNLPVFHFEHNAMNTCLPACFLHVTDVIQTVPVVYLPLTLTVDLTNSSSSFHAPRPYPNRLNNFCCAELASKPHLLQIQTSLITFCISILFCMCKLKHIWVTAVANLEYEVATVAFKVPLILWTPVSVSHKFNFLFEVNKILIWILSWVCQLPL